MTRPAARAFERSRMRRPEGRFFKIAVISTLLAIFVLTHAACGGGSADIPTLPGQPSDAAARYAASDLKASAVSRDLTAACTSSAISLFRALSGDSISGNVFISPLSVSMALSMMTNGANGDTLAEMRSALSMNGIDIDAMNQGYQNLIQCLDGADAGVTLTIANSLWIRESFAAAVSRAFTSTLASFYSCPPQTLDFSLPQAAATINAWISSKTNGLIKDMISEIPSSIVMFVVNAIYFKGDWTEKFDTAATASGAFGAGGTTVQYMSLSSKFKHYPGSGYSALRLPYGRGKIAMYLFLPDASSSLTAFVTALTAAEHEKAMAAMAASATVEVDLKLPKFKFEYGVKRLNDALKKLGMQAAFDAARADFSKMANNAYIEFVDHKAVIDVNEKGSEAAAATVIGVGVTSVPVGRISFTVNRPFLFTIRDDRTGCVLFMGGVTDPKY